MYVTFILHHIHSTYKERSFSLSLSPPSPSLSPSTHLYNGIHRACLLTEPTVDALCHVNVVSCRSPATISSCLCLNRDSLRRTNGLTQFACNTPLLSIWIAPEGVLAAETGANGTLLKWIVDGGWLTEEGT